jgi:hypothetical protein
MSVCCASQVVRTHEIITISILRPRFCPGCPLEVFIFVTAQKLSECIDLARNSAIESSYWGFGEIFDPYN